MLYISPTFHQLLAPYSIALTIQLLAHNLYSHSVHFLASYSILSSHIFPSCTLSISPPRHILSIFPTTFHRLSLSPFPMSMSPICRHSSLSSQSLRSAFFNRVLASGATCILRASPHPSEDKERSAARRGASRASKVQVSHEGI